jgi:hypothetical protein
VGQTALAGLLLDGTYLLGYVEVGQSGLLGVVAQIVGHAVLEFSDSDGGVLGQWLRYGGANYRQQQGKE